jgi:iron complex transport system ATP-binding protein
MAEGAALQMKGVSFRYGRSAEPALRGVDLRLAPGCCLGLIGPNGAGKSTLIKLAAGLERASAGEVLLTERAIASFTPKERGRVMAYVPQSFSLPFAFTALEIVLQGRHPHLGRATFESSRDLEIARRAMEQTGVWELRSRRLDELSGGERQRVIIASALAQEPRLLLMDEPTSSLDLRFQSATVRLVRELVEQRELAVLVALHDLNLASAMCDELALLVAGALAATGPAEEVLDRDILEEAYQTDLHVAKGPRGVYVLPLP